MKNKLKLKWDPVKNDPDGKRYIAIVFIHGQSFDDDYQYIAQHITSWTEVSEEDFKILRKVSDECYGYDRFLVIERPKNEQLFAKNTVQDYIEFSKEKIKAEKERKELLEKRRLQKAKKDKEEKEKRDKELFEQLKQKFEK